MSAAPRVESTRRPGSDVPGITGLTLLPHGSDALLVNISETGLLAESTTRLQVASPVTVQFRGTFSPSSVVGRVVRSEVAMMGTDGLLWWAIAIEFASPIPLGGDAESVAAPEEGEIVENATPRKPVRNRW